MNSHKDKAVEFLQMASSGKIREAYEKYVSPNFKHHNPWFKGDRESLMKGMEENHQKFPNKKLTVYHVFEDGDLVAVE